LEASLRIFAALIPNIKVKTDKVEEKAAKGFVAATEVANMLVSKYGVAFRTSHKIVGALVKALIDENKTLNDVTPHLLAQVAMDSAGIKLVVKSEDLVSCTNLRKIIETYKVQGGPSSAEVQRALKTKTKKVAANKAGIAKLKSDLTAAETALTHIVNEYKLATNKKT
jgi:argininosuccinate lyase